MFTPTAQPFPGRQSSVRTVSNGVVYARTRGDEGGGGRGTGAVDTSWPLNNTLV